jgi:hypothetical protein
MTEPLKIIALLIKYFLKFELTSFVSLFFRQNTELVSKNKISLGCSKLINAKFKFQTCPIKGTEQSNP